jgi:uncharacterized membrane protein YeaQ/YmgE (transglycosylase-associated protein family)
LSSIVISKGDKSVALNPGGLIGWIVVGLIAGWLTGLIMRGGGFGIIGDLIVGLIGALIGGFVIGLLFPGTSVGLVGSIVVAVIGAVILVLLLHLFTRGRSSATRA